MIKSFYKNLFIDIRFFQAFFGIIVGYILSFFFEVLFIPMHFLLGILVLMFIADIFYIFSERNAIIGKRITPLKLSLGDDNPIEIQIENKTSKHLNIKIIDEIPVQFQERSFEILLQFKPQEVFSRVYSLNPVERGEYQFGALHVFIKSKLGFIQKRFSFNQNQDCKVYPSFIQLKDKAYLLSDSYIKQSGTKLMRRLGHTLEFEQISNYYQGDDIKSINWKATAKRNQLMVNQYQDEKSQQVYAIIDKGRSMQMPFNGLSLLDHAVNSTLFLLNLVHRREDRAGMFTFSNTIENRVVAEKRGNQLQLIQENLYKIDTNFKESDFGKLYSEVNVTITHRSLLVIFTNFETIDALNRQLKYLKAMAKKHLLLVVFFENTEINDMTKSNDITSPGRILKVNAEHFLMQKKRIAKELSKHGIKSVLTTPENLTVDTINNYLMLKNRGLI